VYFLDFSFPKSTASEDDVTFVAQERKKKICFAVKSATL
jgi:hypothetical protein